MKRLAIAAAIMIIAMHSLAAFSVSMDNPIDGPFGSVSYSGRFSDVFSNPAALPLMETDPGPFAITLGFSDSYKASDFPSERLPMFQDQDWTLGLSFLADHIALSAFFGTDFDRHPGTDPVFDIHSSLRLELDMAYALPFFSFGVRISGGNSMIRSSKTIDNISGIFANAWFSPFDRESGSEFFDVGLGAILTFGPFSGGAYVGRLITLRNDNIYVGWDEIAESSTVSISLGAGRFLSSGDLRFFRPRASFSVTGLADDSTRTIEAEAEVCFQFLPDSSFSIAASYLEQQHSFFHFNPDNAFVNIFLRGEGAGITGTVGVSFKATDWTVFAPSIGFSYVI